MSRWLLVGYVGVAVSFSSAVVAPLVAGCSSSSTSGDGGAGGAPGAVDCASLVANEETTAVPVVITNHTSADIFVQNGDGCNTAEPLSITDSDGKDLDYRRESPCGGTCNSYGTCTSTCTNVGPTRIAPQGKLSMEWNGAVLVDAQVPKSCLPYAYNPSDPETCPKWVKPTSSVLTFTAKAYAGTACPAGMPDCACVPDTNGTCHVTGMVGVYETPTVLASAVYHEGDKSIEIVFE